MRLLIYEASYRRLEAEIAAHGPAVEPLLMSDAGEIRRAGQVVTAEAAAPEVGWMNADVFMSAASGTYVRTLLKSPDLAWVQSGAAGLDHPVFRQIVEKGARLTTSHGQAVGIAEYVLAGALDAFQGGPERRAAQARGEWLRKPFREVAGSRWLIIGFGEIGQKVAERARPFGAHVTAVRRNQTPHPAADRMAAPGQIPALVPEADVVVLACPLTDETRGLADGAFFAAMAPGAVFVNVGRGGLVDEAALLAALDRGTPERAILDVFETEPLPAESPFWRHPRVALSAHTTGLGAGAEPRNDRLFLDNLGRYIAGQPLLNEAFF